MRVAALAILLIGGCFSKPEPPYDGIDAIAAGAKHACHLDRDGFVRCWGNNQSRQAGPQGEPVVMSATLASPNAGWTAIAAGRAHTCGIREGAAYCWGNNDRKQVTSAAASSVDLTRVDLPDGAIPERIFAGGEASCAIDAAGSAYCWGHIDHSGSTNVAMPTLLTPAGIAGPWRSVAISDDHACALGTDDTAYCWGRNGAFQTGEAGPDLDVGSARQYVRQKFRRIAAGAGATLGVTTDGALWAWGDHANGLIGDHSGFSVGNAVGKTRGWSGAAAAFNQACAVGSDGVFCYGDNDRGALGTFTPSRQLADDPVLESVRDVVTGEDFACALRLDGGVACWGANVTGELGNGEVASHRAPQRAEIDLQPADEIKAISAGDGHTCVLVGGTGVGGRAICWGDNRQGQVKPGASAQFIETPIESFLDLTADVLASGDRHNCAREAAPSSSEIRCWGDNRSSQLGPGAAAGMSRVNSVAHTTSTAWQSVAAGGRTSCARTSDTKLWCWGETTGGTSATLQDVEHGRDPEVFKAFAVGDKFGIALDFTPASEVPPSSQQIDGWGTSCLWRPDGTVSTVSIGTPLTILNGDDGKEYQFFVAGSGGGHGCRIDHDPTQVPPVTAMDCFGVNDAMQVSMDQTNACPNTALREPQGPNESWSYVATSTRVAVAANHTCAISSNKNLYCWGGNELGELSSSRPMLPPPANNSMPDAKVNNTKWESVATGRYHTCAIYENHRQVDCWGANRFGELGDGTRWHPDPVDVKRADD